VFSPTVSEFRCKISEGVAGLLGASWGPDSRQVVTFADLNVHLTFWSLSDQSTLVVPRPKDPAAALAWTSSVSSTSEGADLVAVATRTGSKDRLEVLHASNGWTSQASWAPGTLDLAALAWSPDGGALVVQDTCLRYLVLVYSPRGDLLSKLSCYENALGVRSLSFAPCCPDVGTSSSGLLLAIASYDQSVRLVNGLTWQVCAEYAHTHPKLIPPNIQCRELELFTQANDGSFLAASTADDFPLPTVAVDDTKLQPKIGVGMASWSHDGRFLATRNDNTPQAIWVWDVESTGLRAVLVVKQAVRAMAWAPQEHLLTAVAGDANVTFWSPSEGARSCSVAGFAHLSGVELAAEGRELAVAGQLGPSSGSTAARKYACCVVPRQRAQEFS